MRVFRFIGDFTVFSSFFITIYVVINVMSNTPL